MTGSPPTPDHVGTVAEEVAKLLALLGQRTPDRPATERDDGETEEETYPGHAAYEDEAPAEPAADERDETCREHPRAGEALTCALCPICQGIAVLRTLQPETVDRLADLATAAAAALRELAAGAAQAPSRPAARSAGRGAGGTTGATGRGRTVDIQVVDDEELNP